MASSDTGDKGIFLERFVNRVANRSHEKRRELRQFILERRRNRTLPSEHTSRSLPSTPTGSDTSKLRSKSEAKCVIDVLTATTAVAQLASNINDASRTCGGIGRSNIRAMMRHAHEANATRYQRVAEAHVHVCIVNVAAIGRGLLKLATVLSLAANNCAMTVIPNVDAVCSGSITALLSATFGLVGASTLTNAACRSEGWYRRMPLGSVPSTAGDTGVFNKMVDEHPEFQATPRRLMFGGGKGSLTTQCVVQVLEVGWNIAALGFVLDSAVNSNSSCKKKEVFRGEPGVKGLIQSVRESLCTVDVAGVIVTLLTIIAFAELISVSCTNYLNMEALCASGLTGLAAAAAGIAQSGAALYIACDVAQRPLIKRAINGLSVMDTRIGKMLRRHKSNLGGALLGRRLRGEDLPDLREVYATPADAWKSLGYDLDDPAAAFRQLDAREFDAAWAFLDEEDATPPPPRATACAG